MPDQVSTEIARVARHVGLANSQVASTVALLDAGNTIPFVTRYRRDQTGGLDEEQIARIQSCVEKLRQLEERKQTVLRSIKSQGKLTPELQQQVEEADSSKRLEDLYFPFRPKKQTLATQARERGLEPLADEILAANPTCADLESRAADFVNPEKQVDTPTHALLGAGHILAERFSERADVRHRVRRKFRRSGKLVTTKGTVEEDQAKRFRDYLDFSQSLSKLPPHRILAINRGERAKALRVRVEADIAAMEREAMEVLVATDHPHAEFLRGCVTDSLSRLIVPSLDREVRRELTERAEAHAVEVFARNLRNLLLQPPVRGRRVLAIDPGFKNGCKLAALDEFGGILEHHVVFLVGSDEKKAEARAKIVELVRQHELSVTAIGNGTACRETEELIADLIGSELSDREMAYVVVNEAGASVYSTSALGREEFPEFDAMQRSAVSIGRRMQDPLSELVKIDPASIGVGLYQHDAKAKHLRSSLDRVVQSCVSYVGVAVNSASVPLLRYVSGLNQLTARRLYDYRAEHGPFKSRSQLAEVPGVGDATFVQAAGFLKIEDGENPLDATWIHPESYEIADQLLQKLDCKKEDLTDKQSVQRLTERVAEVDQEVLSQELGIGQLLLKDLITALIRPGRDPREDLPPPTFRKGVVKLEDLSEGMELSGTVLNVVDFGAFVDIGLSDSGLVHISQLANRYVRDPHDIVTVGGTVKVWVTGIDKSRRRVSLTMIEPGTETTPKERAESRPDAKRSRTSNRSDKTTQNGSRSRESNRSGRPQNAPKQSKPKPKPKPKVPAAPITKAMEEGQEPMRTFGDLLQFHQKKSAPSSDDSNSQ